MKVQGSVMVCDILAALDIDLPADCRFKAEDTVDLDDVEVDNDLAAEELPESYFPSDTLCDELDETDVLTLAEAIRCGDTAEAELMLDRMFAADATVAEWVQRGRYSMKARKARSEKAELKAAA